MKKCRPVVWLFFVTDSQLHLHPQTARLMLDDIVEPCQPTHLLRERGAGHQLLGAIASRRSARCGPPSAECPLMALSHPGLVAGDQLLGVVLQDAARAVVLQRCQHQPVVHLRQGHLLHPEGDLPQQVRRRSDRCVSQRSLNNRVVPGFMMLRVNVWLQLQTASACTCGQSELLCARHTTGYVKCNCASSVSSMCRH